MGQEYGEKIRYNPNFKGPVHNRSCTDIVWLIIFILFLGGWGYVGYYSYIHGNVEKLLAPIDSKGRRCGIDSGLQNKKYLVFFDIVQCLQPGVTITGCNTPQVCVEKCPQQTINFASSEEFSSYRSSMVCTEDVDINTLSYNQALDYIEQKKCAKSVLESKAVLSRCIGDLSKLECKNTTPSSPWNSQSNEATCLRNVDTKQKYLKESTTALDTYVGWIAASWVTFFTNNERETHILASQIVQDLVKTRWYLLGGLGVVVIICLIYIALLRWVAGPVVWTSILGLFAALIYSLYVCYQQYAYYKKHQVTAKVTTNLKGYVESLFTDYKAWMVILIIVAVFTLILLLIVIFLRNRIVLACALIKEGSKAVVAVKTTVFFPIIPWLIQCVVILYGILVLMYLLSIGESAFKTIGLQDDTGCTCTGEYSQMKDYESCIPEKFTSLCFSSGSNPCKNASCHFTGIVNPNSNYYFHAVNLLGFFWALFFIGGVADMMLASTFSTWYWTFHKRDLPFFTLTSGIGRTLRYHLGTVAFGSLIIAIVRVIRVILEYVDRKLKKYENPVTKCIMCCCKCCLLCLENFLKFINKNAYIMCAVHGTSFCTSARDAFSLLMRNIVRVVVLDKVTNFIFFLSKVLISVGIGFGVNYLFTYIFVTQEDPLHYYAVPAVILSIATYLVSTVFFNVYSMAIDTLFLCFLEDNERNDGSPEKPYFMSKNLMKILGKKNKL